MNMKLTLVNWRALTIKINKFSF